MHVTLDKIFAGIDAGLLRTDPADTCRYDYGDNTRCVVGCGIDNGTLAEIKLGEQMDNDNIVDDSLNGQTVGVLFDMGVLTCPDDERQEIKDLQSYFDSVCGTGLDNGDMVEIEKYRPSHLTPTV